MKGFAHSPMGNFPFGHADWAETVLWDELPEETKQEDLDAGGYYYKFVTALMPAFNELQRLVYGSKKYLIDPATVRGDLLKYVASKFGIILDFAEPEAYQRTRVEIAGRWRLIKGKREAYEVLCAIHGFNVDIKEVWWTGTEYSTAGPTTYNEVIGTMPVP